MAAASARPLIPALTLSRHDVSSITSLLRGPAGDQIASGRSRDAARKLPGRLLGFLDHFRHDQPAGAVIISGFPVDDAQIGPTPRHWAEASGRAGTALHERYLLAVAGALGEVFAFRHLQAGRLVQDLLPITGREYDKSGNSSRSMLDLHTEDAFHPHRCDYLGLLCLRNADGVPTAYAELDPASLPAPVLDILFEPRFLIEADPTHGQTDVRPHALLWGPRSRPYLRIDIGFTEALPGDDPARAALAAMTRSLAASERAITLRAGEALFIDNHRAAHGRAAFRARYDGTDRWLKRVCVSRDHRPQRALRDSPRLTPG